MDIVVGFEVEQTDYFVACGETFVVMEFVLEDTLVKVAAYSDVQRAGQAAHDVDAVVTRVAHRGMMLVRARVDVMDVTNTERAFRIWEEGRDASTAPGGWRMRKSKSQPLDGGDGYRDASTPQ